MTDEAGRDAAPNVLAAAAALVRELRTLHLATIGENGEPHASYAPFVACDGAPHVFLSLLAPHAANLVARPEAGVLIVRDECASREPFARERLALRCRALGLARDDARGVGVLDRLEARFGGVVATLRELPDFRLFRLEPRDGRLVLGFGRACELSPARIAAAFASPSP